jgi:hypothetical protein
MEEIKVQQIKMLSLYDYLGKAAGSKLGKQVAEYAKLRKARYGVKEVNHHGYQGLVQTYTEAFLKECFNAKKVFEPQTEDYTEINTQLIEDSYNQAQQNLLF